MATQPLDFSDLGGRPVPHESQAGAPLDFSDLGAQRVSTGNMEQPASPEKPSLWSRVTAAYNPEAHRYSAPVRFLDAAGGAMLAFPGNIYHAFADDPTEQEQQEFERHTRIPGELAIERLTGAPLVRGVRQYVDPATRPTLKQAMSVLPEALGQGVGTVAGAEATAAAASQLGRAAKPAVTTPIRAASRYGMSALNKAVRPIREINTPIAEVGTVKPLHLPALEDLGLPKRSSAASDPSLVSIARTMPGEVSPETIYPETPAAAQPIPPRSGLALPPAPRGAELADLPRTDARSAAETGEALGQLPKPGRLVDQIAQRTTAAEPYPRLIEQVRAEAPPRLIDRVLTSTESAPDLSRPVTENPVVGSLVRAMQKSGVPIAKRPSLLLKGSGRVNRILGPEEDLTGPLTKGLRLARWQKEQ